MLKFDCLMFDVYVCISSPFSMFSGVNISSLKRGIVSLTNLVCVCAGSCSNLLYTSLLLSWYFASFTLTSTSIMTTAPPVSVFVIIIQFEYSFSAALSPF